MAKTFEDNIARLEEIVTALEKGDAKLADSLKLFEEGTKLVHDCGALLDKADATLGDSMALFEEGTKLSASLGKLLDKAEQKVAKLSKGADGAPVESPFISEE